MKFTLSWLKTHLRDRRLARRDHRHADPDRPGTGRRREPRRRAGIVPHRPRDRGGAAPERRPAARLQGGYRRRHRLRGVRRAECPHRHEGRVRRARAAFIPGTNITLKVGEIRGVQSAGMLLSAREMGLGDDHSGIIDLPARRAGRHALRRLCRLDDPVIEISVTPNRGDCFSVRGVARDLAAAGIGTLKPFAARGHPADVRRRPALGDRLPRSLPLDPRPHHPRREELAQPEMAAGPADLRSGCGRSTRWST